jgi:hypothetical protein
VKGWRVVEQVQRRTALLRGGEHLPRGLLDLIRQHGIDPERAALADLIEGQGGNLCGSLVTAEDVIVRFDIDFAGDGFGDWVAWGQVEAINRWEVSRMADQRPRQGTPEEVAMRMLRIANSITFRFPVQVV